MTNQYEATGTSEGTMENFRQPGKDNMPNGRTLDSPVLLLLFSLCGPGRISSFFKNLHLPFIIHILNGSVCAVKNAF